MSRKERQLQQRQMVKKLYERMQPVGDTFCYVSPGGEDEDSARSICRYSLTDRELTTVSIDWPEGGNNWDIGYRFFTQDQGLCFE